LRKSEIGNSKYEIGSGPLRKADFTWPEKERAQARFIAEGAMEKSLAVPLKEKEHRQECLCYKNERLAVARRSTQREYYIATAI
jgi:hypothetical protein